MRESFKATKRSVKEWSPDEQPREKLARHGAEVLSNAELIAILLRTGNRDLNVIEVSRNLLNHFDGLPNLIRKSWVDLKTQPGLARVKAITLEAAFELARRIQVADLGEQISFRSPDDVVAFFAPKIKHLQHEVFLVAFLDNAKHLIGYKKISSGGSTSTIVDPPMVLKNALLNEATSIILVHNHPSGLAKASHADVQLTKRIAKAGQIIGIPVDDHVIIAGNNFVSLRSEELF